MPDLAVLTTRIGAPSETFIRRHIEGLAPGRTRVLVRHEPPKDATWGVDPPAHVISDSPSWRRITTTLQEHRYPPTSPQPRPWWPSRASRRRVSRILRHRDVVLVEYLDEWLPVLPLLRRSSTALFFHAHGYDVSARLGDPWWRRRYRNLNVADGIITMSKYSKIRLIDVGVRPDLIHVIPYGVEVARGQKPGRAPGELTRCLAVGRLVPKKDPLTTLCAFAEAQSVHASLTLDIVGEGPLRPAAERFVVESGLSAAVTFHGALPHDEVSELMARADIFLQHSRTDPGSGDEEGLPVALLEAMAAELPVVTTRHAGIPEAIEHRVSGLLGEEGDASAMAAFIVELATNHSLRLDLGRHARCVIAAEFDLEQSLQHIRTLLAV